MPRAKTTSTKTTPTKRTTRKKISVSDAVLNETMSASIEESPVTSRRTLPKLPIKKSYVITLGAVLLLIAVGYVLKGWFVAAVVNGEPISRLNIIRQLERTPQAKEIMTAEVQRKLIHQEARKRRIYVTKDEIDKAVKEYQDNYAKEGRNLDEQLKAAKLSKDDFIELYVRLPKLLEKMVEKEVKQPTDKEIAAFIEQNKESLPAGQSDAENKKWAKDNLVQTQMYQKVQALIESIQKNAKVTYWVSY